MTVEALLREAAKLAPAERGELLDALLLLDAGDESEGLTPAQQEDLDRRIAEYDAGKTTFIAGDEVFARLRDRSPSSPPID